MGFASGVTGGVTVSLGLAYLAVQAHGRHRREQSSYLRAQTSMLECTAPNPSSRTYPLPDRAPSRNHHVSEREPESSSILEVAKSKWNAELEGAVRWMQKKDWTMVREGAEEWIGKVLNLDLEAPLPEVAVASESSAICDAIGEGIQRAGLAKETARAKVGEAAEDSWGFLAGAVERGNAMEARARAAVAMAEEKVQTKVGDVSVAKEMSPVERTLQQRYEKSDALGKSINVILEKRLRPLDKQDLTELRGL